MNSGGDNVTIHLVCNPDGQVLFQAPARVASPGDDEAPASASADGFRSDAGGAVQAVGMPLVKTFWFDHLDVDHRELQQIVRRAGNGKADRVRVWMRVDEHQLIRAELSVTPMLDETGRAKQVLVRTEPTRATARRRDPSGNAEPTEKPVRLRDVDANDVPAAAPPAREPDVDLLALPIGVPMARVELKGSVVTANDLFAKLLGRPTAAECANLPLTEFVRAADRQSIVEALAVARAGPHAERSFEVRLNRPGGEQDDAPTAQFSFVADPHSAADRPSVIVVAQDRSLERRVTDLSADLEQMGERLAQSAESSRRLDRLFERAPFGLALFEHAQPVRTNAAFDAQTSESAGWVDALAHRAMKSRATQEQHSTKQSIASFWLGGTTDDDDTADELVGAVITPAPREAAAFELQLDATLRAMDLGGRVAAFVIGHDGEIRSLGRAMQTLAISDAPAGSTIELESLFDEDAVGEYRSVTAHVRSSKAAVTTKLALADARRPCFVTFAPFGDGSGSTLMLIEDQTDTAEQIDAARDRMNAAQAALDELRAGRVDPVELERIRRQLTERRDQVRALLDATASGAFSWDLIDGTVHADERSRALLACDATDAALTPSTLFAATDAKERDAFERQLFDAMSADGSGRVDLRMHVGPDHEPVRIVGHVVFDPLDENGAAAESSDATKGDPTRLVAAVIDLRGERRSEDALRKLEAERDELANLLKLRTAELNAIFECAPDAIRIRSNGMMRHNAVAATLFGGDHLDTMFSPRNGQAADRWSLRLLENGNGNASSELNGDALPVSRAMSGEIGSALIEMRRAGEPARVVQSNAAPIVLDGNVVGAVSIEADLTEQRSLEAGIRTREEQIAGFFQNTGVGIAYLDARGTILDVNPQLSALLGAGRGDLVDRSLGDMASADDRSILAGQIEAVLSGELTSCSSEVRLKRRDGAIVWTQLTITPRQGNLDADGNGDRSVVALVQDIDELRRLRERVAESSTRLATLAERYELISTTTAEGFLILDLGGRVVESNDAARKLLGLRDGADAGTAFDHLQFESPETGVAVTDRFPWQRALRGKATTAEYRVRRRPGGKGDAEAKSIVVQIAASPGPRSTAIVNIRDITTRHGLHEDLQQAYARIVEAHTMMQQRTKQLEGNFVSAVRQLSAAVGASAPLARAMLADPKLPGDVRNPTRQLVDALRVHDRLVQHFVADTAADSATASAPVRAVTDMHALLEEATRLVTERFHAAAGRITPSLEATRVACRVDGALVRHAFWSVLAHAASQSAKEPAKLVTVDAAADGDAPGGAFRINVTWPGARANTAELTLARALIESERGSFALATADGHTTATMEFTPADEPLAAAGPPAANANVRAMRVVLVEDHDSTARVLTRQLTRLRCDVTLARTLAEARTAIDAGKSAASTIDLLVCDLTMPDGNALDLVRRATTQRKIPTIGLRSYGGPLPRDAAGDDDAAAALAKSAGGLFEQLVKPVDLNALASAIARITGNNAGRPATSKS